MRFNTAEVLDVEQGSITDEDISPSPQRQRQIIEGPGEVPLPHRDADQPVRWHREATGAAAGCREHHDFCTSQSCEDRSIGHYQGRGTEASSVHVTLAATNSKVRMVWTWLASCMLAQKHFSRTAAASPGAEAAPPLEPLAAAAAVALAVLRPAADAQLSSKASCCFGGEDDFSMGRSRLEDGVAADQDVLTHAVTLLLLVFDVSAGIAVTQALWAGGSSLPASFATAFICLPVSATATALAAALWRQHRQSTARVSRSRSSWQLPGSWVTLQSSGSSKGACRALETEGNPAPVRQHLVLVWFLVLAAPLLLAAGLLLVLLLDLAAAVGIVLLPWLASREGRHHGMHSRMLRWEVVLRQHWACRLLLQAVLQSLPMLIITVTVLATNPSDNVPLLSVCLASSALSCLSCMLGLLWSARRSRVPYLHAVLMWLRYDGAHVLPAMWAEKVPEGRQSVQLNLRDSDFARLHRLQKTELIKRAISSKPHLIISNSLSAATLAAAAARQHLPEGAAAAAAPRSSPQHTRQQQQQALLLAPSAAALQRLVALLPAALPAACLMKPPLQQQQQQVEQQQQQMEQQQDVVLSLVTFEDARNSGPHLLHLLDLVLPLDVLTTLVVKDTPLPQESFQVLFTSLQSPACRLHTVLLSATEMPHALVPELCGALAVNTSVRRLDLSCNRLGPAGPAALGSCLATNTGISELVLSSAGLNSAAAAEILAGACLSRSLRRLDLSQNHLRDDVPLLQQLVRSWQVPCQGQANQRPSQLTQLDLSFNWIQDNPAGWLLLALELFPALTHLHLNHNNFGGMPNTITPDILSRQATGVSYITSASGRPSVYRQSTSGLTSSTAVDAVFAEDVAKVRKERGVAFLTHLLHFTRGYQGSHEEGALSAGRLSTLMVLDLRGLCLPAWFMAPGFPGRPACLLADAEPLFPGQQQWRRRRQDPQECRDDTSLVQQQGLQQQQQQGQQQWRRRRQDSQGCHEDTSLVQQQQQGQQQQQDCHEDMFPRGQQQQQRQEGCQDVAPSSQQQQQLPGSCSMHLPHVRSSDDDCGTGAESSGVSHVVLELSETPVSSDRPGLPIEAHLLNISRVSSAPYSQCTPTGESSQGPLKQHQRQGQQQQEQQQGPLQQRQVQGKQQQQDMPGQQNHVVLEVLDSQQQQQQQELTGQQSHVVLEVLDSQQQQQQGPEARHAFLNGWVLPTRQNKDQTTHVPENGEAANSSEAGIATELPQVGCAGMHAGFGLQQQQHQVQPLVSNQSYQQDNTQLSNRLYQQSHSAIEPSHQASQQAQLEYLSFTVPGAGKRGGGAMGSLPWRLLPLLKQHTYDTDSDSSKMMSEPSSSEQRERQNPNFLDTATSSAMAAAAAGTAAAVDAAAVALPSAAAAASAAAAEGGGSTSPWSTTSRSTPTSSADGDQPFQWHAPSQLPDEVHDQPPTCPVHTPWEAEAAMHPAMCLPSALKLSLSLPGAVLDVTSKAWRRLSMAQQVAALYFFLGHHRHVLITNISRQARQAVEEEICMAAAEAQLGAGQQLQATPARSTASSTQRRVMLDGFEAVETFGSAVPDLACRNECMLLSIVTGGMDGAGLGVGADSVESLEGVVSGEGAINRGEVSVEGSAAYDAAHHRASLSTWLEHEGSRLEARSRRGSSHLAEHMLTQQGRNRRRSNRLSCWLGQEGEGQLDTLTQGSYRKAEDGTQEESNRRESNRPVEEELQDSSNRQDGNRKPGAVSDLTGFATGLYSSSLLADEFSGTFFGFSAPDPVGLVAAVVSGEGKAVTNAAAAAAAAVNKPWAVASIDSVLTGGVTTIETAAEVVDEPWVMPRNSSSGAWNAAEAAAGTSGTAAAAGAAAGRQPFPRAVSSSLLACQQLHRLASTSFPADVLPRSKTALSSGPAASHQMPGAAAAAMARAGSLGLAPAALGRSSSSSLSLRHVAAMKLCRSYLATADASLARGMRPDAPYNFPRPADQLRSVSLFGVDTGSTTSTAGLLQRRHCGSELLSPSCDVTLLYRIPGSTSVDKRQAALNPAPGAPHQLPKCLGVSTCAQQQDSCMADAHLPGSSLLPGCRAVLLLGAADCGRTLLLHPLVLELPLLAAVRHAQMLQQQEQQQQQGTLPVVELLLRGLSDAQAAQFAGLQQLAVQLGEQQGLQHMVVGEA